MPQSSEAAPRSLLEVLAEVPDPRDPRGTVYPLPAVLALAAVAMLGGAGHPAAIVHFAEDRPALAEALGFRRHPKRRRKRATPGTGQLHYLFKALDAAAFESALTRWLLGACPDGLPDSVLSVDGKTLRGSRRGGLPGLHLLSAFGQTLGSAVARMLVSDKTNEHKAALELLKVLPLEGITVTGDAALAQKDFCGRVLAGGGDYFLTVKDNQKTLNADVRAAFGPAFSPDGGTPASV